MRACALLIGQHILQLHPPVATRLGECDLAGFQQPYQCGAGYTEQVSCFLG